LRKTKNAGRSHATGISWCLQRAAYLLLLLPLDFFSPPWLLRLLPLLLEALARSLCAPLSCALALPPLPADCDLPDEEEDFELPDFMLLSPLVGWPRTIRLATGPL
jgi:hypothetical protein